MEKIGAIFDWDGVILDSSLCHEKSWELLAAENNFPLPEGHFKKGFGRKNEVIIPEILKWTRDKKHIHKLGLRKEALYREICRTSGLEALPGVIKFLKRLEEAGIRCVIGSSTHRQNIEEAISVLGLPNVFTHIISGEDVTMGKPHPEVFLKAAERIGVPPQNCIVFEDAVAGIKAAHAGGMKAVGVATTHSPETLGAADLVVYRLDEIYVEDMRLLLQN